MFRYLGKVIASVVLAVAACGFAIAGPNDPVKVIYHINLGNEQATDGLRNANNHLSADPTAKIVFVAHSAGARFLLEGAKDKNGNSYDALVQDLMGKGVEFRLCKITLDRMKIDPKKVIQGVKIVPSGVAEVSRLQAKEGYAYLKP
jgi:intracellular sulfur oxidation DsrE/DsrF family protein